MNAVEIEAAVSTLAGQPFDAAEFPFAFLAAFDKKEATLKRLRKGDSNKSDIPGAVLLINSIHLATCPAGQTRAMLERLKASPKTASARAKFVFATDGSYFEAEDVTGAQEPVVDFLPNLANHFGFFLPLAGISTVREIKDNPIDVRATGRLNKLYVELLRINPEWGTAARRHDMNHFMARLIFCYFAEHTDIFKGNRLFTDTIEQMSEGDGSNTHHVMEQIFRAMDVRIGLRATSDVPPYANQFPYVNGGLFRGSAETPRFNRIARSYLIQAGKLEWQHINPDIFGSMIQAVADDEERGALGMHYTSVPNILKVLNPLFLDDLRAQLEAAGDNGRMLLNLRQRMSRIRVFDPACGSGNFLVIAYKQMRAIEAEINRRRNETLRSTDISEKNFRGIEIRDFAAEIARLALVIAKYQCDVQHRGPLAAKAEFLPLNEMNWITCGNALRLDWLEVCPPVGTGVKLHADDLFQTPLDQAAIDFDNEGGQTFICGNPPYKGNAKKTFEQKADLNQLFQGKIEKWGLLDYVCGWFYKAFEYSRRSKARFAFVATNSIAQGQHVTGFWKPLFREGLKFVFAVRSFKWSNLAAKDAGVTVVCIGAGIDVTRAVLFDGETKIAVNNINAYLLPYDDYWVEGSSRPCSELPSMLKGNYYGLSEHLIFSRSLRNGYINAGLDERLLKKFYGSTEVINARPRDCFWFLGEPDERTLGIGDVRQRIAAGSNARAKSKDAISNGMLKRPHQFREMRCAETYFLAIPVVSSENRDYLPVELLSAHSVISNKCFALYDAPLWNMALIASRLHWVWIGTVCVRLEMRFSYSNTLGWNTFPVPTLTEQNKADLTRCAEDILLAREAHFPATIADLYDPDTMPENLRVAHEANDEVLERIYIGRRFRNDTERLEKLFEMYTKMTTDKSRAPSGMATKKTKRKATA